MSETTVHVEKISGQTTEKEVQDFFSFCGKINKIEVNKEATGEQTANVTFEKPTAAKTALLLDNTQLGPNIVSVSGAASSEEPTEKKAADTAAETLGTGEELSQEDKPRTRVIAEYLAHGYTISDKAIEKAIALDNQHGFTSRFTSALQSFDTKTKASERAAGIDQKYGVTDKAMSGLASLHSYFEKALGTPSGQKVREFYVAGNKQVLDVHNEARRLADLKAGKTPSEPVAGTNLTTCGCGGAAGVCTCEPGKCACASCPKNAAVASSSKDAEQAGMEKVEGTDKTKCNCGGDTGICPCEPGKCACANCPKNPEVKTAA